MMRMLLPHLFSMRPAVPPRKLARERLVKDDPPSCDLLMVARRYVTF